MRIGRLLRVRDGATDLGDRPVVRMAPISNWTRTTGLYGLLAVGDLDRGWLVARVWTLGIRAEGGVNMLARFGMFFYWCGLAIAFLCSTAALIVLMAIITGKLSDSDAWTAVVFFAAVGCISWLVGNAAKYVLGSIEDV